MTVPLGTYRLQLTPAFGFDDATGIVPYLADLGVTHVYLSPCLQAAPGSTHGYDVVDHSRVNDELGGAAAQRRLLDALARHGLGQVLDLVPNHMAIGTDDNRWWWDVLEHGPASWFADHFDIEWSADVHDPDRGGADRHDPGARARNRILVPVLGRPYGEALEAGELRLERDGAQLSVRYFEHRYPLSPRALGSLLGEAAARAHSAEVAFLADSLRALPEDRPLDGEERARRQRDLGALAALLDRLVRDEPSVGDALDAEIEATNGDPDRLDARLGEQHYRLAHWRVAAEELDYRRFFDITTLAGLRAERDDVFEDTHRLVLEWCEAGEVDGLRIDHPDGLRDPEGYLARLADAAPGQWIVVEKILEGDETLPPWPVAGTTGYDVLNLLGGLFVDPDGEGPMTAAYQAARGPDADPAPDWPEVAVAAKRQVLRQVLAADLSRLTRLATAVAAADRSFNDVGARDLRLALEAVLVHLDVYRTYARADGPPTPAEQQHLDAALGAALATARSERPGVDPAAFDLVAATLAGRLADGRAAGPARELTARFQQLSGPVMAKGVEDTAFYRYNRLLALNEVGGDPGRFGVSPDAFHRHNQRIVADWPATMTTTSTHDTKRSEDIRARLALLSEIPEHWADTVTRWSAHNRCHRRPGRQGHDAWPDPDTEHLLYQTLVGAHPLPIERLAPYLQKAVREAKVHTSWTDPDEAYESAVADFAEAILADEGFRDDLSAFVAPLVEPGRVSSLAQTLLKLASPGVPDTYQGTELWDDSLVDPDNRRPVDYELRRRLLAEVDQRTPEQLLARADGGLPKLAVTRRGLAVRRRLPHCFQPGPHGAYRPMVAQGPAAGHVVAFGRGDDVAPEVVVVVPRLVLGLAARGGWGDTVIDLPEGCWTDELTGDVWAADGAGGGRAVAMADLLGRFPVALLTRGAVAGRSAGSGA